MGDAAADDDREGIMRHVCWVLLLALPMGLPHLAAQDERHGHDEAIVPESSLESPFDIGVASHTNHQIRLRPARGGTSVVRVTFQPQDIRGLYGTPAGGAGAIAVVLAYDNPYALSDFNQFSSMYGLNTEPASGPNGVTDAGNAVLQVVYAGGSKPSFNSGWSQESALDIEWSHAMAPGAKIYLVEAASNSNSDLLNAVSVATQLPNVRQISMSWGSGEWSGESGFDGSFISGSICFFAASGDSGGVVNWPSVSPNVVAAGGTTVIVNQARTAILSETGWSGSGGGNSKYVAKPGWQTTSGFNISGAKRNVPDLSSDADPNTGVLVVWNGGQYAFGGTSVASPSLAGMANASGVNTDSQTFLKGLYLRYVAGAHYYDVTSGVAGRNAAGPGYDLVTGVGTPRGVTSFGPYP
jgi:subtilase family serine protease